MYEHTPRLAVRRHDITTRPLIIVTRSVCRKYRWERYCYCNKECNDRIYEYEINICTKVCPALDDEDNNL